MSTTSNMIEFSIGMKTSVRKSICEEEYEGICKFSHCFEYIPDDRPVKLYFDADHFFSENFESYSEEVANKILKILVHWVEINRRSDPRCTLYVSSKFCLQLLRCSFRNSR